jgi:hypothetical protein
MFAVRDKRTGKFLRNFSCSFNKFQSRVHYQILEKKVGKLDSMESFNRRDEVTDEEIHANMWSLDTPNGAKLYKTESGVETSFYSYRFRRNDDGGLKRIPLSQALPWLEIVKVQVSLTCVS